MAYPDYVFVTVSDVGGTSCGPKTHRMKLDASATPVQYNLDGPGDFAWASLASATINGTASWQLTVFILTSPCTGSHTFWRDPGADDPTGTFDLLVGSVADESNGVATITDDS